MRDLEGLLSSLLGQERRKGTNAVADQALALAKQARKVAAQWRAIADRDKEQAK